MSNNHNTAPRLRELEVRAETLIENGRLERLKTLLAGYNDAEITEVIKQLDSRHGLILFRLLPPQQAGEIFSNLSYNQRNRLLRSFSDGEVSQLLNSLDPDDRTAVLEELPAEIVQKLLNFLSAKSLRQAKQLLGYPEESIGRLMTPEFITVRPRWTVGRALEHVRNLGESSETIKTIFVTENFNLLDDISIKDLVTAASETKLSELMDQKFISISPYEDREKGIRLMQENDLYVLPVVNRAGKLLGIVTMDDIMDVARSETTEDFQRLGGGEPLNFPYWDVSLFWLVRKRIGWLMFLFFGGAMTSAVIGKFESQLESVIILSYFIPLIINTGGDAGSQSISTVIRAIAIGEIQWSDGFRVVFRETVSGFLLGLMMGAGGYLFTALVWGSGLWISLVIAFTLLAICTWSNFIASCIPLVAGRIGLDPTLMSVPLITTLVDATGLIIYFSIATYLLGL